MADRDREILYGIYARVSTDRQADVIDGSLDLQVKLMRDQIAVWWPPHREGKWRIVDQYVEGAKSGKNLDRPELQRLKADIEAGRINAVVVCKIDRLSRSLLDFFSLLEFFEKYDVQFHSLKESFDTSNAIGRAVLKILMILAEFEREQTAERTKDAMALRAKQGLKNGSRNWGYEPNPERKGVPKVDQAQAKEVQLMFDKYLELKSTDEVIRFLHMEGIRTPRYTSRRGKEQGGKPVHKQTLINLLRNPIYIGKVIHNGAEFDGLLEPIISTETFYQVQALLDQHGVTRKSRTKKDGTKPHVYLLRGLLRCGSCGSAMTPKPGGKDSSRYPYYVCTRVTKSAGTRCTAPSVPARAIEDHVLERLRQLTVDPAELRILYERAAAKQSKESERLAGERLSLKARLQQIQQKLAPWLQKLMDDGPDSIGGLIHREILKVEDEQKRVVIDLALVETKLADLAAERSSVQIVTDAYASLRDALHEDDRERLATVVSLIVELISWTPTFDGEKPGRFLGGCYKMALFENPLFSQDVRGEMPVRQDESSSQGQGWLLG